MIRIALAGQPNCGKSTLFNHLVGYKANTSNLPGTTVEYLSSEAIISGRRIEVIDLPGTYSLIAVDRAEIETRNYLLEGQVDAVLNVVDASLLSRSLELTLQLLEMGMPLVVCLNMDDEARRKGIEIDAEALAERLGVPVVKAVATRGRGVTEAVSEVVRVAMHQPPVPPPSYGADVEEAIDALASKIDPAVTEALRITPRLLAIQLLQDDPYIVHRAAALSPELPSEAGRWRDRLGKARGAPGETVVSAERHNRAMTLFETVATVGPRKADLRDRIDGVLMHRVLGYVFFAAIMYGFFQLVFHVGSLLEGPILLGFERAIDALATVIPPDTIGFTLLEGFLQGIGGAVGIVLPYLVPFLIGLALLEDIGYLPRAGYLMDTFMHRIGLHGKSVIPFILGYGCSVPAVMATRILDSPRDRFVTSMLTVMIPCVARTTIIYGLIGYYLGPHLAFAVYLINLVVIAAAGKLLTRLLPRVTPGLILEIPTYRLPSLRVIASKVWWRVREFILLAWPLLIGGTIVLALLEFAGWARYLNLAFLPFTWILGLPAALGVTLVFGIFRKELSLIMLVQALGTTQVASVLSAGQMMTFTLFVLFYVPCIATIAVLGRELGRARAGLVVLSTTGIALVVALLARGVAAMLS